MDAKLHEPADTAVIDVWTRAPEALRAEQIKTGRAIFGDVIQGVLRCPVWCQPPIANDPGSPPASQAPPASATWK